MCARRTRRRRPAARGGRELCGRRGARQALAGGLAGRVLSPKSCFKLPNAQYGSYNTAGLAARQLKLQLWVGPTSLLHAPDWRPGGRGAGSAGACGGAALPRFTRESRIHGARRQPQDQRRHTCSRASQDVLNTTVHLRALENTAIVLAGGAAFAYISYIVQLRF